MKILQVPHPVLRQKAAPVTELTPELRKQLQDLKATLRETVDPPGVGLAAPQVGHAWRAFATQLDQDTQSRASIRLFINPVIIDRSDKLVVGTHPRHPDLEGCLSIPLLYAPVKRHEWVTVQWDTLDWQDELAEKHTETFFDFAARVIQHETDHLDGVLFTDHVRDQGQPIYRAEGEELVETSIDLIGNF